jgi:flagellar protein FliO/FliZ
MTRPLFAALLLASLPAYAAAPAAPSPMLGLVQVLLYLGLVLGVFAAFAWGMKRYGPRAMTRTQNIKLVGGLSVGGRERILVVEVADQWIVVGAAPGGLSALSVMAKPPHADVPDQPLTGAPGGKNFADWLKQTIDKQRNGNNP